MWTWRPRATRRSWSTSRRSWGRASESLGWTWRGTGVPSPEVGWTEETGGQEGCRGGGRRPFLLGAQGAEKLLGPLPWWLRPCPSLGLRWALVGSSPRPAVPCPFCSKSGVRDGGRAGLRRRAGHRAPFVPAAAFLCAPPPRPGTGVQGRAPRSAAPTPPALCSPQGDPPERAAGARAALPPGALRAPEVLPAGVHLRGGGPGALPGRGAAAQGDDRQVPGRPESRRPGLRPREPRFCAPRD